MINSTLVFHHVICSLVLNTLTLQPIANILSWKVINYYIDKGSEKFACAFDRIRLFSKLLLIGLSVYIVHILVMLYSNLCLSIFWNGAKSAIFYTHSVV